MCNEFNHYNKFKRNDFLSNNPLGKLFNKTELFVPKEETQKITEDYSVKDYDIHELMVLKNNADLTRVTFLNRIGMIIHKRHSKLKSKGINSRVCMIYSKITNPHYSIIVDSFKFIKNDEPYYREEIRKNITKYLEV